MNVTGSTNNSRLVELRKYTITNDFTKQYVGNGSWTNDGVDYPNSPSINYVVYYIGGIKYVDKTINGTTITNFSLIPKNESNFVTKPYVKNPNEEKIISNPKIIDDVFITRSDLSAYNKNYRLEFINNMSDLLTYAGGKYFKIINNT